MVGNRDGRRSQRRLSSGKRGDLTDRRYLLKGAEFRDFDYRAMLHNRTLDRVLFLECKMGTRLMVTAEVGGLFR